MSETFFLCLKHYLWCPTVSKSFLSAILFKTPLAFAQCGVFLMEGDPSLSRSRPQTVCCPSRRSSKPPRRTSTAPTTTSCSSCHGSAAGAYGSRRHVGPRQGSRCSIGGGNAGGRRVRLDIPGGLFKDVGFYTILKFGHFGSSPLAFDLPQCQEPWREGEQLKKTKKTTHGGKPRQTEIKQQRKTLGVGPTICKYHTSKMTYFLGAKRVQNNCR